VPSEEIRLGISHATRVAGPFVTFLLFNSRFGFHLS
jgi:hypothetical protein